MCPAAAERSIRPNLRNRIMHPPPQFGCNLLAFTWKPLPYGLAHDRAIALAGLPIDVGKAQKLERLRLTFVSLLADLLS